MKAFLESQYDKFNAQEFLHIHPDPIQVARKYKDDKYLAEIAFICSIFAYGNAKMIVKNLDSMPFSLLHSSIDNIESTPIESFPYYRFQTKEDVKTCFLVLRRIIESNGLYPICLSGYKVENNILHGIRAMQEAILDILQTHYKSSNGLSFLFGKVDSNSALKRYNMFLRWMVRKDDIDFGIWSDISPSHLLLPLDTHTFRISQSLGLCKSKQANIKAVLEISARLKEFDSTDPIKYDFALYRIGQLKLDLEHNA